MDVVKEKPLPKINLSELTEAQLLTVIFQQQDTVGRIRQQLAQEEQKLHLIESEGRKRAKPIEETKEEKLK